MAVASAIDAPCTVLTTQHPHHTETLPCTLQVGNTTEGGVGPGWVDDDQASSDFPYDSKLAEQAAADAIEDKYEEDEDKQMILGNDMVNPFTGGCRMSCRHLGQGCMCDVQ